MRIRSDIEVPEGELFALCRRFGVARLEVFGSSRCLEKPVHSTRRELLYLTDIVEAAEAIASFIQGQDRHSFVGNDLFWVPTPWAIP